MTTETSPLDPPEPKKGIGGVKLVMIVISVAAVTAILTVWLMTAYIFPKEFKPVSLSGKEEAALQAKLKRLDPATARSAQSDGLEPEAYSENSADREVNLSEREINALLAKNTDLARKLVIDLSENLASARLLVPLDPDFPILGGKTLKLSAGLELSYSDGRPLVVLRGVSLWGVPMPSAWLGGIKNVDLVREFGGSGGFWQAFSDGVEHIQVEEGRLSIKLRE